MNPVLGAVFAMLIVAGAFTILVVLAAVLTGPRTDSLLPERQPDPVWHGLADSPYLTIEEQIAVAFRRGDNLEALDLFDDATVSMGELKARNVDGSPGDQTLVWAMAHAHAGTVLGRVCMLLLDKPAPRTSFNDSPHSRFANDPYAFGEYPIIKPDDDDDVKVGLDA